MNTILSVILLMISGVSCMHLYCPKSNGKFPVENTDCKIYYECENWKATSEKTCPDGQTFNPTLQFCDYEELYYCAEKEIEKYKRCKMASGKFPKKNSFCKGYYECDKWKVTGEFTCPRGQNFNPEHQWCDWEELYPCLEDKPSDKCPKPNGFFPKLGSQCKSYYECIKGKPFELQCPEDLVFDPSNGQCEWPELYPCDETGESTVETTRITYETTQPTSSTKKTTYSTETTQTTASTERTKSTAETRTTSTTNSLPTRDDSQSTKTERTVRTTSTTEQSSGSTETDRTDGYTLSSTEGSSGTRTKATRGTDDDYITTSTEEASPYTQTKQITKTSTLPTEGTSFGTQTQTECIISSPSTAQTSTATNTFNTASIQTDSPGELICPGATGLFPHPTDETKFLSCLEFVPTVMNCPDDLIYEPTLEACIWRRRNRM